MAEPAWKDEWTPVIYKLLTRSPSNQLGDVLANCRRLVGAATLPAELLGRALSEHNEKGLLVVPLGTKDGHHGIVCDFARQGSRSQKEVHYFDPRSDMLFVVHQERQECMSVVQKPKAKDIKSEMEGIDLETAKPFQEAAQRELDRYLAAHFPPGNGLAAGIVYTSHGKDIGGDIELRVIISSRRSRPLGCWAGTWSSQWRVVFLPGQKEPAKLGGIIEFRTHYAEDGNVHFRRKATRLTKVAETTDCRKFAAKLLAAIGRCEEEFQLGTDELCESFGAGALKAMRRVLPLSKERFDWRPIRHALVRDMKVAGKEGGC